MAESNSTKLSRHAKDETGKVYGKLTVVEFARSQGNVYWICRCECGTMTTRSGADLRTGRTKSCGCRRRTQNGGHGTTEYTSLREMKSRCYNPNATGYEDYGEKGVVVCARWRASFVNFLADMGKKPSPRHSIERINNDGNYSCGHCEECLHNGWTANCKWATRDEQARNRSNSRMLTFNGETMCLADWARKLKISQHALAVRLENGWPLEKALTTPANKRTCRYISYNGKTMTVAQWSRELGIHRNTILVRLDKGWPIKDVLSSRKYGWYHKRLLS